jgi:hypothetical protein
MDDLIDLIAKNESPSDIHSKIKDLLFAKAADNIETVKPAVTASMFGGPNPWLEDEETETEAEAEVEVGDDVESEDGPSAELETSEDDDEEEN